MGRPQVLDTGRQQTLLCLMIVGISQRQAALLVGCDPSTVAKLAARDEVFRERLLEARRQAEYRPLQRLARQSEHSWRANIWLLERTMPHKYGSAAVRQPTRQAAEQAMTDLLQIVLEEVSDPQTQERIARRAGSLMETRIDQMPHAAEVASHADQPTASASNERRAVPQAGSAQTVEPAAVATEPPPLVTTPRLQPPAVGSQPAVKIDPPKVNSRTLRRQRHAERRHAAQRAERQRQMETVARRRSTLLGDPPLSIADPRADLSTSGVPAAAVA